MLPRTIPAALAALLLTSAAFAADRMAPRTGAENGPMSFLTQNERMMLFVEMLQNTQGMTDDQRMALREAQRAKLEAMSDADKKQFAADLDTQWNALPADQKAQIEQKLAQFHGRRHGGGQGGQ